MNLICYKAKKNHPFFFEAMHYVSLFWRAGIKNLQGSAPIYASER